MARYEYRLTVSEQKIVELEKKVTALFEHNVLLAQMVRSLGDINKIDHDYDLGADDMSAHEHV